MLIGNILEDIQAERAWHLCADKLADRVRDIWLQNTAAGVKQWEVGLTEDFAALPGLADEGIKGLVGLDYIFKWWGGKRPDDMAGEVDIIWKTASEEPGAPLRCRRSWIKMANQDFLLNDYKEEYEKREVNRAAFREAFALWLELFRGK